MIIRRFFCRPYLRSFIRMTGSFTNSEGVKCRLPGLPTSFSEIYVPGQMFQYQKNVERLPVMPLKYILDKYLLTVEPLLTADELNTTRKIVKDFGRRGGMGENLHKELVERSKTHENWLIDWWNYFAYLAFREPVVINVSPGISYPYQPIKTREETAAKFVSITARYMMTILSESIPPELYRDKPFCMSQYIRGGCRIPGKVADTLTRNFPPTHTHMVIMRKGHFYKLDVFYFTSDGEVAIVPASFLADQLQWIVNDADEHNPYPVGVLTTCHRDDWFRAREILRKDSQNRESCDTIESATYGICLDEGHPMLSIVHEVFSEDQAGIVALRAVHGNGIQYNTCNRWFDLTSQLFIGEDGGCGTILEHSALDGVVGIHTNLFAMNFIKSGYDVFDEKSDVDTSTLTPAYRLKWNLSEDTIIEINKAKSDIERSIRNFDFHTCAFEEFGKDFPKSVKLSPDGFFQSALLLAYYKLYCKMPATYESGSMRWFKYGRTDTIRSCTNASYAFVKSMMDKVSSSKEKAHALLQSVKAHSDYTLDAMSGKGIDRHLLGLKIVAANAGLPLPEIFQDVGYQRSTHFSLSTSQVPIRDYDIFLCFGAVVPDGYGVCYNPQPNKFLLSVSSYFDCPDTDSMLFAKKVQESLSEMKNVLIEANIPKPKL